MDTEDIALPKAAIFDLDGTLLDSVDLHALAWQEAMVKFGHDVTFEQVRSQIGKGGDRLIPVFLSEEQQAIGVTPPPWHLGQCRLPQELYEISVWPHDVFSQRATCPPRSAVRQRSIALIAFNCSRHTCP
jgi:phosphoglycolate phosphatase-like HAD superfamily hydrolase